MIVKVIILLLLLLHTATVEGKDAVEGNIPMVHLLGVQKGGSSSLFEFMIQHPLLCSGKHKEPHFFDRNMTLTPPDSKKARLEYSERFPDVLKCNGSPEARYIDGSTVFGSRRPWVKYMDQFYTAKEKEKLKFIVVVREPVSRDYSWYSQVIRDRLGREGFRFKELHTLDETRRPGLPPVWYTHVERNGDYVRQLKNYLQFFRRDQLLILTSSALFRNSSKIMDNISKFLDIENPPVWSGAFPHDDHLGYFAGIAECITKYTPKLSCSYKEELARYYEPLNEEFYNLLKETQPLASKWEPPFEPFGDSWKNVKCVDDARKELDKLIASSSKRSCIK